MTKCDSLFTAMRDKCYYKVWQVLLQSATACSLQCATSVITKCDKCYYKVRQLVHCNVRQVLLQSVTSVITKCDKCYYKVWHVLLQNMTSVITKCDRCYYKVRQEAFPPPFIPDSRIHLLCVEFLSGFTERISTTSNTQSPTFTWTFCREQVQVKSILTSTWLWHVTITTVSMVTTYFN